MITKKGKTYEYTLCNGTYVLRARNRERVWGGRTWNMDIIRYPKNSHLGPSNTENIAWFCNNKVPYHLKFHCTCKGIIPISKSKNWGHTAYNHEKAIVRELTDDEVLAWQL